MEGQGEGGRPVRQKSHPAAGLGGDWWLKEEGAGLSDLVSNFAEESDPEEACPEKTKFGSCSYGLQCRGQEPSARLLPIYLCLYFPAFFQ